MEKLKKIIESKNFKVALYIVAGFLILIFTFQFGMMAGFERASFSNKIGEDYFMQMRGRGNGPLTGLQQEDFLNSHGAIGKIVGIKLPNITIEDRDGDSKVIQISTSTQIKYMNIIKKDTDIKLDDFVVVFGAPTDDNPVIEAKLIRIMPPIATSSNLDPMNGATK